jgi:hypothetical protein
MGVMSLVGRGVPSDAWRVCVSGLRPFRTFQLKVSRRSAVPSPLRSCDRSESGFPSAVTFPCASSTLTARAFSGALSKSAPAVVSPRIATFIVAWLVGLMVLV